MEPDNRDYIYDLETYPNIFTFALKHVVTGQRWLFEISFRRNDIYEILQMMKFLKETGARMIGYNNEGFDYPVLHTLLENPQATAETMYNKCQAIIFGDDKFEHLVWESDRWVEQIDLFKIHHFDNQGKRTRLKDLEFNMKLPTIEDLPFPPGTHLNDEQCNTLVHYNMYGDVDATERFYLESLKQIKFREKLTSTYDKNFMNANDTKIGEQFFIMCLEGVDPNACYYRTPGSRGKTKKQTKHNQLRLKEAILPYVRFNSPELNNIKGYFESQVITETKGVFEKLNATLHGFTFHFGLGGIHGSIESQVVCTDQEKVLIDLDVASYYPNLMIVNKFHPEHLGQIFCDVYKDIYEQRKQHKKGTVENQMLKLALNGSYGKTNSKYSPLFDSMVTMKTTINGQLLLCMLAESLFQIPGLEMVQVNTDGLTVRCPRMELFKLQQIKQWWEDFTCLELEDVVYNRMFIRDVNNYIGEYEGGKLKRKGAYEYELDWHQNHSQRVVAKVAERALVHGDDIRTLIYNHGDMSDFFLKAKVKGKDILRAGGIEIQKVNRYYVAVNGVTLVKHSPPVKGAKPGQWKRKNGISDATYQMNITALKNDPNAPGERDVDGVPWSMDIHTKNKSTYEARETKLVSGRNVVICNDTIEIDRNNIDYEYYIAEVEKLVLPLVRR